jgi:hypothetical protein
MENETTADLGGQTDIVERSAGGEGALSVRAAANSLVDTRRKDVAPKDDDTDNAQQQPGEARDRATAGEQESDPPGDDTGPDAVPGETQEADPEPKAPPIEPPRSWTKEDKELFKGLPRDTQERLVERERSRESDFLRRQNEAAEHLKGLAAKEQQAEQVRTQYEQALPTLLQALQQQRAGEFADIKSIADIERLAREDWPRYVVWDAQQKNIAAVAQEVQASQQRQEQEKLSRWNTFAQEQDSLFLEKATEFAADRDAYLRAANEGAALLRDLGFTDVELAEMWHGKREVSLRDHRIQLLLRDGVKYRDAQAAAKKAAARPVPNVQRPGPAAPRNADADERLKALDQRLTNSGSLRDAAAALAARRAASRR